MIKQQNIDNSTAYSFGEEWNRFNQENLNTKESKIRFNEYFRIFPWDELPMNSVGVDIGCGSGRWDKFVAPRVGKLHCVEPAQKAIEVAKKNLHQFSNIVFHNSSLDDLEIANESQDFLFSIGVLHHVPDTLSALKSCVNLLKPGAPILIYLYYKFDNRASWFKFIWRISNIFRNLIIKLSPNYKNFICEIIALIIYLPLARVAYILEKFSFNVNSFPLSYYRKLSFYSMRTDSRDRFGTPLEKRFTKNQIIKMCKEAGLEKIKFSNKPPYWCFVANKK